MRPQFYNFIKLFKENITVDYISSDLEYWECDLESKNEALQFMKDKNYDLLVIRKGGNIIKKALTKEKKIRKISHEEIIPEDLPITDLLGKFITEKKNTLFPRF